MNKYSDKIGKKIKFLFTKIQKKIKFLQLLYEK